ncbi:MAG TPA: hypothetical protein VFY16_09365 [Gemmatimonadaceae bacterium]|nr:hypothetical protein [Gemmatimonadaceae bacterium]
MRRIVLATTLGLLVAPAAGAQSLAPGALAVGLSTPAVAAPIVPASTAATVLRQAPRPPRGVGRQLLYGMGGAVLGAGLGYFASQVAHGSWESDEPKGGYRTGFAVGGAALGAVSGFLIGRNGTREATGMPTGLPPREYIGADELRESGAATVLDAIRARRALWLNVHGTDSFDESVRGTVGEQGAQLLPAMPQLVVYLDESRLGGVERLQEYPVAQVEGIRWYDARQATYRWGAGHNHGVIQLLTQAP